MSKEHVHDFLEKVRTSEPLQQEVFASLQRAEDAIAEGERVEQAHRDHLARLCNMGERVGCSFSPKEMGLDNPFQ